MTLLLFSVRHRSLVTVHTDLHGHTASGCLCRSRLLQWCLIMYLSRLSACPKTSQRGAPSSGISLLGTKSNQQVLNLANGEYGGWSSTVTFRWAKNCLTIVALCQRVWNKARTNLPFSQIFNYNLSHCVLANVHLVC